MDELEKGPHHNLLNSLPLDKSSVLNRFQQLCSISFKSTLSLGNALLTEEYFILTNSISIRCRELPHEFFIDEITVKPRVKYPAIVYFYGALATFTQAINSEIGASKESIDNRRGIKSVARLFDIASQLIDEAVKNTPSLQVLRANA